MADYQRKRDISAFILAGGASSRMGTDKGLMDVGGKPMVEHVIDVLRGCFDDLFIVSNNDDYKKFGLPVYHDVIPGMGPLSGIHTGLTISRNDWNLIVACDMPFINRESAGILIQSARTGSAVIPYFNNKPEPLFGLYHKSALPTILDFADKGVYKLQSLLLSLPHTRIDIDPKPAGTTHPFMNINTPVDLKKILHESEKKRYSRQIVLDEIGIAGQIKLKSSKVLVVGAGGLGCPVLLYLAAAGVGTIGVADYDNVDISNLHRQVLYNAQDIGKSKALTAKAHLNNLNPDIEIHAHHMLLNVTNCFQLVQSYDIIVDGTDNFATRYMLNDVCVLLNKTLVYGSVLRFSGQVSVLNRQLNDGNRSGTYRCLFPVPPVTGSVQNCADAGVAGVIPGLIGTLQATEVIKIITGAGIPLANTLLTVDLLNSTFSTWHFTRNRILWHNFPESRESFESMNYDYFCDAADDIKSIDREKFEMLLKAADKTAVLDVREPDELPELTNFTFKKIPLAEINDRMNELDPELNWVVLCARGNRSRLAVKLLREKFPNMNIVSLEGGIESWFKPENHLTHG